MASTYTQAEPAIVETVARTPEAGSYIDWAAIIAGAVFASAISFILFTFGSAIGLTLASPFEGEGIRLSFFAIASAIWAVWAAVSSFMAGGYLAGRMRRRMFDATEDESDMRDGAHGLLVWGVGVLVGALFFAGTLSGVVRGGTEVASSVASGAAAGTVAAGLSDDGGVGYIADKFFRAEANPVAAGTSGTSGGEVIDAMPTAQSASGMRGEVGRILAASMASGTEVPEADRAYIARLISNQTGMEEAEAEARVDAVLTEAAEAAAATEAAAREAADTARRLLVLGAFLTAASLLVAAVGAWWAAGFGGRHRDEGTILIRRMR